MLLQPEEVPNFMAADVHEPYYETAKWLRDRGYHFINANHMMNLDWATAGPPRIVCGPTPRSRTMQDSHAVVFVDREMVYDPHPSEAGLTAITAEYLLFPRLA